MYIYKQTKYQLLVNSVIDFAFSCCFVVAWHLAPIQDGSHA